MDSSSNIISNIKAKSYLERIPLIQNNVNIMTFYGRSMSGYLSFFHPISLNNGTNLIRADCDLGESPPSNQEKHIEDKLVNSSDKIDGIFIADDVKNYNPMAGLAKKYNIPICVEKYGCKIPDLYKMVEENLISKSINKA